ncbi:MAG: VOC family protein [Dehalococcoidia bacterium]|nr:VOC family protein [Dehalococcoidia bacterium]
MPVKPIPDEYRAVTPYLVVEGAADLIRFVKDVFGAEERMRVPGPGGTVGHCELVLRDSTIMLSDAGPMNPAMPAMLMVYVENVDETYRKALAAGASSRMAPEDRFYGDRAADVADRFGNRWSLATHVEDVSPEEMQRRLQAAMPGAQ